MTDYNIITGIINIINDQQKKLCSSNNTHNRLYALGEPLEDYIKDVLKKSSTFSLEDGDEINLEKEEESGWKPLFEPKSEPKIYHLIYAKKGSEAGDFYNQKTINFIYKIVSSGTDIESFDPIE